MTSLKPCTCKKFAVFIAIAGIILVSCNSGENRFAAGLPGADRDPVYVEHFTSIDPSAVLGGLASVGMSGAWTGILTGKGYRLVNVTDPNAVRFIHLMSLPGLSAGPLTQGTVSVRVAIDGKEDISGAGLLFGYEPDNGHYYALIATSHGWACYRRDDDGFRLMLSGSSEKKRPGRVRHLAIHSTGPEMHFFVDGKNAARITRTGHADGGIGIIALSTGSFIFDNFSYWSPEGQVSPAASEKSRHTSEVTQIPGSSAPVAETRGTGTAVRLIRTDVRDPMLNGMVAYSTLIPDGWQIHGGISWRLQQTPFAVVDISFYDPQGMAAVRILPHMNFYFDTNLQWISPGNLVNMMVFMPPPFGNPSVFIQSVIIPHWFAHAEGISIKDIESLPAVAAIVARSASAPGLQAYAESYRVRLSYQLRGHPVEEDVHFSLLFYQLGATNWQWSLKNPYSLRASRGELDRLIPLLRVTTSTCQLNPDWIGYMDALQQYVAQGRIANMQQLGNTLNQLYWQRQQVSDLQYSGWTARQAAHDRMADAYSQHIRGVQSYQTPDGGHLELPSQYGHAWIRRGGGEVFLSNDPNFDPSMVAGGSYDRMMPMR